MKGLSYILDNSMAWVVFWILPLLGFGWFVYYLIGLPLRRQERGRFFLDLLETGLQTGRSPERTIVDIARSRDESLGLQFQMLAAHLQSGLPLGRALAQVPHLLPPGLAGMLRAGMELGDLSRVLPACRRSLGDGLSKVRSAFNYQVILMFTLNPILLAVIPFMTIWIFPVLREIYAGFGARPPLLVSMFEWVVFAFAFQVLALVGTYLAAILYVGGPRVRAWIEAGLYPFSDWLAYLTPWKHTRMMRDFSSLLAALLDSGVEETRALDLAAEAAANRVFRKRVERARANLAHGQSLTEAVALLDDTGEFRWRLANAARGQAGFRAALEGWHEALDARAFGQEQTAAQILSTGLALANGLLVALFAIICFQTIAEMYRMPLK